MQFTKRFPSKKPLIFNMNRYFTSNINDIKLKECISQLQNISHELYSESMNTNNDKLMDITSNIDNIVLRLSQIKHSLSNDNNPSQISLKSDMNINETTSSSTTENPLDIPNKNITQSDVDEINEEMNELFGNNLSFNSLDINTDFKTQN